MPGALPPLTAIVFLPLLGAVVVTVVGSERAVRWLSLITTLATLWFAGVLYYAFEPGSHRMQFVERRAWIDVWGIDYAVGVDGISVLFVLLTALLSVLCVAVSWRSIDRKVTVFHASLLVLETAMIGVFVSLNLFLFYLFWELMLIPMFLLIGVWGGPDRVYAAVKFVLFTLAGSVFMLIGIVVLYTLCGTLDIEVLAETELSRGHQLWLFCAFTAAFAVKVPMFPLHTWLPDAHTEAPTAGSVVLAGILLKMGGYGFLRLCMPLFPSAVLALMVPLLVVSLTAIVYGAYVTLIQSDLKRLIAYSSISHMGFVTLGLFTLDAAGIEGGILQMINHGVVTGALFLLVGIIYERSHSRRIDDYGELGRRVPTYSTLFAVFTLAAIGVPGLNTFVGEFLIISAAFRTGAAYGLLSILGVVLGVTYMLWLFFRIVLREAGQTVTWRDLDARELLLLLPLAALVVWLGVQPAVVLEPVHASVAHLVEQMAAGVAGP